MYQRHGQYHMGFYLALVRMDPKTQVDVGIHSQQWHGRPLVQVVQTDGSFTMSSENSADMPLNGYIRLDVYTNTLTRIYEIPDNFVRG